MEDLKQKNHTLLQKVCLLSYIRLIIIILFMLTYFLGVTNRDFWWDIVGAFTPDLFALLLLVQVGALVGTYLTGKKKWTGFAVYAFFHLTHFLLLNFGIYELYLRNLILSFIIMILFIILFIIAIKKGIKQNSK